MVEARVGERQRLGAPLDDLDRDAARRGALPQTPGIGASGSSATTRRRPPVARDVEAGAGADLQHFSLERPDEPLAPLGEALAVEPAVQRVVEPLLHARKN